jgi:hypothetical protein
MTSYRLAGRWTHTLIKGQIMQIIIEILGGLLGLAVMWAFLFVLLSF